ncbi:hypothetical protein BHF72_1794 [Cloacibacterium normanense]|uniref:Uncharacterized protein n=1 Tax=Cloacibacterium normanense TaxID=237258 RepID=A0A1E5UFP9_9FLAO|nr:hypothetical protein BHF72_1794 [Cloacibacterium normanense]
MVSVFVLSFYFFCYFVKNSSKKVQAEIHYPFLINSFDFPLTLLWVG